MFAHSLVLKSLLALVEGSSTAASVLVQRSGGSTLHTCAHGHSQGAIRTGHEGSRHNTRERGEHDAKGTGKVRVSRFCALPSFPGEFRGNLKFQRASGRIFA